MGGGERERDLEEKRKRAHKGERRDVGREAFEQRMTSTSSYIIMCWTLRMSPLEGYREQHEYQTFSLQSCAAYFHSLNVLMKHSTAAPAPRDLLRPLNPYSERLICPDTSSHPQSALTGNVCQCCWNLELNLVFGPHLLPSNLYGMVFSIEHKKRC